jgi:hypothetical protein
VSCMIRKLLQLMGRELFSKRRLHQPALLTLRYLRLLAIGCATIVAGVQLLRYVQPPLHLTHFPVQFYPEDTVLAVGTPAGFVETVNVSSDDGKQVIFHGAESPIIAISFSPHGQFCGIAWDTYRPRSVDGMVSVLDTQQKRVLFSSPPIPNGIDTLAFSPDGKLLAIGTSSDEILVWETESWHTIKQLTNVSGAHCLAFSPSGNALASGGSLGHYTNETVIWDTRTWSVTESLVFDSARGSIAALAFSHDGKYVAAAAHTLVRVWGLSEKQQVCKDLEHTFPVRNMQFSRSGNELITAECPAGGSDAGGILCWDVATGEALATIALKARPLSLTLSSDSQLAAVGCDDGRVTVLRLHSRPILGTLRIR